MFETFQKAVRDAYLDLKNNKQLDFSREWPSTGDLKNWCIQCFEKGLSTDDEVVFVDYFREKDEKKQQKLLGKSLKEIIKDSDTDKFRSLRNFIIGDTKRNPDRDVVKLLAVLINFRPRPYDFDYWNSPQNDTTYSKESDLPRNKEADDLNSINNCIDDNKTSITSEPTSIGELPIDTIQEKNDNNHSIDVNEEKNEVGIENGSLAENQQEIVSEEMDKEERTTIRPAKKSFLEKNKYILRFGGIASFVIAIFFSVRYLTPEDCMCWNGERYVKVDCADKTQRYQIIGLNKQQLDYFERIQRKDTLSVADVGRVWYSKIDNEVEFFTQPGLHPVNFGRSLKLATEHIINKYAGKNANTLEDKSKNSTVE